MKTFNQIFTILIVMLLLGALAAAGMAAFDYVRALYMGLDPQLARITAASLLALLIAAWIIVSSVRKVAALRARQRIGGEMAATYQYFVDYWTALIAGAQQDSNAEASQALGRLLALYGSADVIKAHLALQTMLNEKDANDPKVRMQFRKALADIRKDMGRDLQGIRADELLQLILPAHDRANTSPAGLPKSQLDSQPSSGL